MEYASFTPTSAIENSLTEHFRKDKSLSEAYSILTGRIEEIAPQAPFLLPAPPCCVLPPPARPKFGRVSQQMSGKIQPLDKPLIGTGHL
jgi:hypothetical protein